MWSQKYTLASIFANMFTIVKFAKLEDLYCYTLVNYVPYNRKFLRTINFVVFKDFTTTSKIISLKSHNSTESYDSLVDLRNIIHKTYRGETTSKIFCLKNYPLYGMSTT